MIWKILLAIGALVVVLGLAAGIWVRVAPLPKDRLAAKPGPMEPGVHKSMAGVKVVRPLASLPPDAFARLVTIARETPRTTRIGAGDDPATFVTRSALWGFPDIATIWTEDGALHVASHLVFGKGDMGVNGAKVTRWFEALEADGADGPR